MNGEHSFQAISEQLATMTRELHKIQIEYQFRENLLEILTEINRARNMEELRNVIFEIFSETFADPWGLEVGKDPESPPFLRLYSEKADLKKGRRKLVKNIALLEEGYVTLYLPFKLEDSKEMVFATLAGHIYPAADRFRMGLSDQKTHLWNASHFQYELEREVARAGRYRQGLSVIFIDLDGFKELNDRHGHTAGDQALSEVADILRRHHRLEDTVSRWGGDEFLVALPQTGIKKARHYAEQIRLAIGEHRFPSENGERTVRLTASIGVASRSKTLNSATSLIKAADDAMYISKNWGKDRVTTAPF